MMVAVVVPCVQSIDNSCDIYDRTVLLEGIQNPKAQPTAGKNVIDASDFGVKKGFVGSIPSDH